MKRFLLLAGLLLVVAAAGRGQGAGLPTTLGWFQIPNTAPSLVCPSYSDIQATGGCAGGFLAWSGGFMDNRRNRLILRIGGHTDYFGNELYALDLNANPIAMVLAKDASHGAQIANIGTCVDTNSDGSPRASHNYFGPNYFPTQDRYFFYQAFISQCGNDTDSVWLFDPSTTTASGGTGYTHPTPATHPNHAQNGSVPMWAYDYVSDALYEIEANVPNFWKYDPANNTFTNLSGSTGACPSSTETSAAIDPTNRFYVCVGNGNFWKVGLGSPFTATNLGTPTGCSTLVAAQAPGWDYDPLQKVLVGYVSGNSVIQYNVLTNACTTVTFAGGPTGNTTQGNFGKFRYAPGVGGFVFINTSSQNAFFLRLVDPATAALNDFNNRVAAAGVLTSQNFDSAGTFNQVTSGEGCFISTATNPVPTHPLCERETSITRSGASSLRFVVPGKSDDRPAGWYVKGLGLNLANGQTIYVSYSQRMDAGYLLPIPAVGGGTTYLKNHIMAWWDGVNNLQSCANPDWVTVNPFNRGWPSTYMQCGSDTIQHNFGGIPHDQWDHNKVSASTVFDQGYDCPFNAVDQTPCFKYPTNVWVTYLYKLQLGHYGTADSTLSAWVSTPSSPAWRQFMYEPNHNVIQDTGLSLNMIQLLPYWTGRDGTVDSGATGTTYYDELITSTQPIAPPAAPPASAPPVGPATDVYLSQVGVGTIDGSSCANARAVSYFNASGNWGTGLTQIGSGTVVHLCGTITSTLTAPASQGTGLITIKFEPSAVMQQAAASNFIGIFNRTNSYLITGQTPCGFQNHVFVACTEKIRNTANGSPDHFPNQVFSVHAIDVSGTSGSVTVQNLEIGNLYVHDDPADAPATTDGAHLAIAVFADQMVGSITVQDNYIHDASWAIPVNPRQSTPNSVLTIARNDFFHNDHDIALGSVCNPSCYSVSIHDNHSHDHTNWNTTVNEFHHDGIHIFGSGTQASEYDIYNNLFDGPWSGNGTAFFFDQAPAVNLKRFNNVMICDATCTDDPAAEWEYAGGANELSVNNTFIQTGLPRGPSSGPFTDSSNVIATLPNAGPSSNVTFLNNILANAVGFISMDGSVVFAPSGLDYNLYANCVPNGNHCFTFGSTHVDTLASWQTLSGEGTHSQLVGDAKLSALGVPQTGSPAIGTGTNLTSLCIGTLVPLCSDYNGAARPATGNWSVGAIGNPPSGIPLPALSISANAFYNQMTGTTTSIPAVATLSNNGTATLTISSISFTGTNPSHYAQTNNCGAAIAAGTSCTINITFSPSTLGPSSATLNVNNNASLQTVTLSGNGMRTISGVGSFTGTVKVQ